MSDSYDDGGGGDEDYDVDEGNGEDSGSDDVHVEHESESFGERVKNSCSGPCIGILLIIIAMVLLFWNEGRTVKRTRDIREANKLVVSLMETNGGIQRINNTMDGQLVYLSGVVERLAPVSTGGSSGSRATATTVSTSTTATSTAPPPLVDPVLGVTSVPTNSLKLLRDVKMYQWKERSSTKSKKTATGTKTKTRTYTYSKEWSSSLINSDGFRKPSGHTNPSEMLMSSEEYSGTLAIGAFTLPPVFTSRVDWYTPMPIYKLPNVNTNTASGISSGGASGSSSVTQISIPHKFDAKAVIYAGNIYIGGKFMSSNNNNNAVTRVERLQDRIDIGDLHVSYRDGRFVFDNRANDPVIGSAAAPPNSSNSTTNSNAIAQVAQPNSPGDPANNIGSVTAPPTSPSSTTNSNAIAQLAQPSSSSNPPSNNAIAPGVPNPNSPNIGDLKISYEVVIPDAMSIIAKQQGNTLVPYTLKKSERQFYIVSHGKKTIEEMFDDVKSENSILAWVLRLVGFLLLFFGILAIIDPIMTIIDVIPILGDCVQSMATCVSFFIALILSAIVIIVGWLAYRPVFAAIFLVGIGGIIFLLARYVKSKKKEKEMDEKSEDDDESKGGDEI